MSKDIKQQPYEIRFIHMEDKIGEYELFSRDSNSSLPPPRKGDEVVFCGKKYLVVEVSFDYDFVTEYDHLMDEIVKIYLKKKVS